MCVGGGGGVVRECVCFKVVDFDACVQHNVHSSVMSNLFSGSRK